MAATSGTVRALGHDPRHRGRAERAGVGLVMQSTSLGPQLTVQGVLRLFAGLYPAPHPVAEILDLVDLASEAATRIGSLFLLRRDPCAGRDHIQQSAAVQSHVRASSIAVTPPAYYL